MKSNGNAQKCKFCLQFVQITTTIAFVTVSKAAVRQGIALIYMYLRNFKEDEL